MDISTANLFSPLPGDLCEEHFEQLAGSGGVRIERIVSLGHASPEEGWYDQEEQEWVVLLDGSATLLFEEGGEVGLRPGDYLAIPAHCRHKVLRTDPDRPTVWLAVFWR